MEMEQFLKEVYRQVADALNELIEKGNVTAGNTVVIGCSTSEVCGGIIGKNGSLETAEAIVSAAMDTLSPHGIHLAAQCCEHLNRAIVLERAAVGDREIVAAVPKMHAGGSLATVCYQRMEDPVLVEEIRANAGLDIGGTLIGMHLKRVAVPVRLAVDHVGSAPLIAAYTRPKYIGGERAKYE